jgi:hypothetical protein
MPAGGVRRGGGGAAAAAHPSSNHGTLAAVVTRRVVSAPGPAPTPKSSSALPGQWSRDTRKFPLAPPRFPLDRVPAATHVKNLGTMEREMSPSW